MDPLLVVIVSFGLIFVVTASLAQGLVVTPSGRAPLRAHRQLNVMIVISNFIVMPALLVGLAAIIPFHDQVKMAIIALAVNAGAPFIPWLVSLGKGDLAYSVGITLVLMLVTIVVQPIVIPPLLRALDTGANPSPWLVLWPMLLFMLLPLVIGVIIRARYPKWAGEIGVWLGPISVTFLVVHVTLFIGYSWSQFLSLAGGGQIAFTLVFPLAGLLIGYLLSPPYVLSPLPASDPQRGSKIVSSVAVAEQNTSAAICLAIFALGKYVVAGDYILLAAMVTIVIVMFFMLEFGTRFERKQRAEATAPGGAQAPRPIAEPSPRVVMQDRPSPAGVPRAAPPQKPQGDE